MKLTTTPPGKDRQTITAEIDEATHEMGPTDLLKMLQMYEQAGLDPRIPPESYRNLTNRRRYLTFLAVFGGLTLMSGLAAYRVARSR